MSLQAAPANQSGLQVWVTVALHNEGTVLIRADSDSQLSKGLCAILIDSLGGRHPEQVLQVRLSFLIANSMEVMVLN